MPKTWFLSRKLSLLLVPLTNPDPNQAVGTGSSHNFYPKVGDSNNPIEGRG